MLALVVALGASLTSSACTTSTDCSAYLESSISEMRRAGGSGCFELAHVVLLARTPSASAPRLYVQDREGGDFSAVMAKCSPRSEHACPLDTGSDALSLLNGTLLTLHGYYRQGARSGFEELYLDEIIDEGSLHVPPAPVDLGVGEIARDARVPAKWFQRARVTVPEEDPLVLYDFTPDEFSRADACPAVSGFAMIPRSAGAPMAKGCQGEQNPPSVAVPDPREILVGRQFYSTFWASTDCRCGPAAKQHLLTAYGVLSGVVEGIPILEIAPGETTGYQVFEPTSKDDFPVSGG